MYRDWENIIHVSFFMKQFLSPSQKIMIPKQCIKKEIEFFSYRRNKNIFANTIKSNVNMNVMSYQYNFFSCIYTKGGRKRSQLFKETTWVVKHLRHWSVCKCNDMQTWFSMLFWHKLLWFQYITWIVFFW